MRNFNFIHRQYFQIRQGGWPVFSRKVINAFRIYLILLLTAPLTIPFLLAMRLLRPWLLIRINPLRSDKIGAFAANLELYICERDAGINVPKRSYMDLCFHAGRLSNKQLAIMWGRHLRIWPAWLVGSVSKLNKLFPGGSIHAVGPNTHADRDVHNLIDRFPPHLSFLPEENELGEISLRALGIPMGAPFICLNVRDSAYLSDPRSSTNAKYDWSYHNYRDCNIQSYTHAAQELANRGYYVVRMGAVVKEAMSVAHPMIIDYATNGMRSDFMDIYLAAKCEFCISTGTGFDALPFIFRRPIVYVDHVPLGSIYIFSSKFLVTTKKHWLRDKSRFMTFREIFESGAGYFSFSSQYEDIGIDLIESTPGEIAAVVLEMESRLKGTWKTTEEDEVLQHRFWEIFKKFIACTLHGEIRSCIGADFLRQNKAWLE